MQESKRRFLFTPHGVGVLDAVVAVAGDSSSLTVMWRTVEVNDAGLTTALQRGRERHRTLYTALAGVHEALLPDSDAL